MAILSACKILLDIRQRQTLLLFKADKYRDFDKSHKEN